MLRISRALLGLTLLATIAAAPTSSTTSPFLAAPTSSTTSPFSAAPTPLETFDAGILHVEKFGGGKRTLILIPGLASGTWAWYGTIAKFSPDDTIYAITLPGFDGRPATTNGKSLFAAFTRDFWEMLSEHKIDKPIVIGHSIGGTLAILLGEQHPERLAAIIAADGTPVFPMAAFANQQQREVMAKQMADSYTSLSPAEELAAEKSYMSSIGTNKPELVDPTAQFEARSDPKAVAAWMSEDLTADLRPDLNKITIPFLEIMPYESGGMYTQPQTLTFYQMLLAGAPKATVVPITPSRHFVMLDQPEAFYKAVAEFLSSIGN